MPIDEMWVLPVHWDVDVEHLECFKQLQAEKARFGSGWMAGFQQDSVRTRIGAELSASLRAHAVIVATHLYRDWEQYFAAFLHYCGVIEACPEVSGVHSLARNDCDPLNVPLGRTSLDHPL